MESKRFFKKLRWEYVFIAVFLLAALTFVCIKGTGINVAFFDNMDSSIAWKKMLKDNGLFFTNSGKLPFLGGLDRNLFSSDLKCYNWLYMIFPTFVAYIAGWFIRIGMSMAGFALLGKEIFPDYKEKKGAILFCGMLYGILPVFPSSAFGFASLPLLLWLMIKLYRTNKWRYLTALLFYPMLSSSALFGIFICASSFVFFVANWIVKKKPSWKMLLAVFALGIGYMVTEWRLFYSMLFSGTASIRTTYLASNRTVFDALKDAAKAFLLGHDHSGSLHTFVVLPVCLIYFFYLNIGHIKRREGKKIFREPYNLLILLIVINSLIFGLDTLPAFKKVMGIIPQLKGINYSRMLWFNPFLWYFAFLIVILKLRKKWQKGVLLILAFAALCFQPSFYNTIYHNLQVVKADVTGTKPEELTYKEYYSEDLFDEIKEDIGYDGEWSVAFGMQPAILNYNEIATLDGYSTLYPAEYKEKFRELIAPDFETDKQHEWDFDSWGGRAYVFSDEVDYLPGREKKTTEANMKIDPEVFREMGGEYVFSRVSVKNAGDLGLEEIGVYSGEGSPYTIYVYRAA